MVLSKFSLGIIFKFGTICKKLIKSFRYFIINGNDFFGHYLFFISGFLIFFIFGYYLCLFSLCYKISGRIEINWNIDLKWVSSFLHNVVKWPNILKKSLVLTPQNFIVCLAILQHYAWKGQWFHLSFVKKRLQWIFSIRYIF